MAWLAGELLSYRVNMFQFAIGVLRECHVEESLMSAFQRGSEEARQLGHQADESDRRHGR